MHESVMQWIGEKVKQHDLKTKTVLEVGSLNVNGSVRQFFKGPYLGIDRVTGHGVDTVVDAHSLPFQDESFDVVISTEMIEHDEAFWLSLSEMGRVLRKDGLLILTARSNGFPLHSYPHDYFRFMPDVMPQLAAVAGCLAIEATSDPECPGIFLVGRKCS